MSKQSHHNLGPNRCQAEIPSPHRCPAARASGVGVSKKMHFGMKKNATKPQKKAA